MPFYVLAQGVSRECPVRGRVVAAEGGEGRVVVVGEEGDVGVVEEGTWQWMGGGTHLTEGSRRIKHILTASTCQDIMIVQTFKQLYLLSLSQLLLHALSSQNTPFQALPIQLPQKPANFKVIKQEGKVFLKVLWRKNGQITYFYYELDVTTATLTVRQQYKQHLKNQCKFSLQSEDKDIVLYEAVISKFKPIKLSVLSYYSHQSSDTAILEEYEVLQFEEQCVVREIFKISKDIVCIVTNSHCESQCSSSIILFNCHLKYTINHITVKDVIITQTHQHRTQSPTLSYNTDLSLDCFAKQGTQETVFQVFPFCTLPTSLSPIPSFPFLFSLPSCLLLQSDNPPKLWVVPKVSKKAIYLHWLRSVKGSGGLLGSVLWLLD